MPRSEAALEIGPVEEVVKDYGFEHPQAIGDDYAIVDRFENTYVPAFHIFGRDSNLCHCQAGDRG